MQDGATALFKAAHKGHSAVVGELLKYRPSLGLLPVNIFLNSMKFRFSVTVTLFKEWGECPARGRLRGQPHRLQTAHRCWCQSESQEPGGLCARGNCPEAQAQHGQRLPEELLKQNLVLQMT